MTPRLHAALMAAGLPLVLASCQQPTILSEEDASAFADEVEPTVESALVGLSDGDYERHTRDFDDEFRDRIDVVTFPQVVDEIIGPLGHYKSHEWVRVEDQGRLRTVVYEAALERDPDVEVHVVFQRSDPEHHITGLWFDSELLRGAVARTALASNGAGRA